AGRGDHIRLLAILILEQRQARRADRIIFDAEHRRLHAVLLPFEIDDTQLLLVTAADTASGGAAIMIAPAGLLANLDQALLRLGLRNVAVIRERYIARRRRQRSKCLNWHKINSVTKPTKSVASKLL